MISAYFILTLFLTSLLESFVPVVADSSLKVEVSNLRNDKGDVIFLLYKEGASFPDKELRNSFKKETGVIKNDSAIAFFSNIPPGVYAVTVVHDENDDQILNRGLLLPKEGIGFSNYQSIGLTNRPQFSKASFRISKDTCIHVKMIYMK
ncbi:hypothetical protein JCM18694_16550 [Prolixibacter denitrificans]|nr:hypothetical protein JCM18694_16550 [Prolixibacter denitrificans]